MNSTLKRRQRGAFLMARDLLVIGILVALAAVPFYMQKKSEETQQARRKAEVAARSATPPASAPVRGQQEPRSRGLGYGLTYELVGDALAATGSPVTLKCHVAGAQLDRPHQGGCNPVQGDMSCRMVLPLLCIKPGQRAAGAGAAAAPAISQLGATQPVMGAVLESDTFASARCALELGPDWRAADTQDAAGDTFTGMRDSGLSRPGRYWVNAKGPGKGNCWNSDP
jgi:hypothetical protein